MANIKKTIIKLRRDTIQNYSIYGTHVPENGEACLVDSLLGVRVKIGDGVTAFNELAYADSVVVKGFYDTTTKKFYKESTFITELEGSDTALYIDKLTGCIYYFDNNTFKCSKNIPNASATEAGILKLYTTTGQNEDGTMTQKAITNCIDSIQFEVNLNTDNDYSLYLKKSDT